MMWNFNEFADSTAAITEQGQSITYRELAAEGSGLASKMPERSLVFCLCKNEIGALLGYTACLNHKIVPLLLDSHLDRELLAHLLDTYKPAYVWVPQESVEEFPSFACEYQRFSYALLKTGFAEAYPLHEELALLLTTSGSTGSPKLVRQSYKNIRANTASIVSYLELDHTERPITTLPMNYTYGLSIVNSHLSVGATLLLTGSTLMQKEFWNFFKEQGATSFGGVPYTYEMLKKLRFFRMELPSLRTMTQAGGKLSPELHHEFAEYAQKLGKKFVVMYGQTEATARMAYLPHEHSLEKYGSMGIAIPGGHFDLIDVNDTIINQPNVTGELVYTGDNVTLGYAERGEDLCKGDERHGVLVTGDMAKRDADGYYFIVGRKKRFLKIFGNRVNLDESERMIKSNFEFLDCACAGVDDKMYIFVTDASKELDVKRFISEKTGLNPSAFHMKTIDTIPKNEAGKTLYIKLESYYD